MTTKEQKVEGVIFESEEEVYNLYKNEGKKVVIYQGLVYDVADYMSTHPGGEDLIENELGKNIDVPFEEAEHTKSAKNIFKDLEVIGRVKQSISEKETASNSSGLHEGTDTAGVGGFKLESKFNFDYNKGLFWQIWYTEWTFEEYYQYINEPKHLVNPVRNLKLFDNYFCEIFTMTPWWLILVAWSPTMLYNYSQQGGSAELKIALFCAGMFFWTFMEYVLHRFLFHMEDQFYFVRHSKFQAIHFMVHGIHHAFPSDPYRLVFPPFLGHILYYTIFLVPIRAVLTEKYCYGFILGIQFAYLIYDLIHYFFHHATPKDGSWLKMMKVYHMQHHYKNGTVGFGVSNKLWDIVFGTELVTKSQEKEIAERTKLANLKKD